MTKSKAKLVTKSKAKLVTKSKAKLVTMSSCLAYPLNLRLPSSMAERRFCKPLITVRFCWEAQAQTYFVFGKDVEV